MTGSAASAVGNGTRSDGVLRAAGVGVRHRGHADFTPADVWLHLDPGEVVLLLGPSGCGKSTFALTVNGLVPQSVPAELRGTVAVGAPARDAATTPTGELATSVAMVFQDPDASVVTGSVLDEVCFGPENLLLPVGEVLARAEDALRRVGLWERRDDDPDVLSGGGRQRLAVACALAQGSPLLVLDEPTANLDPAGIEEFYATLADVVADGDRSVLLVEHNLDACVGLVDRVVVLDARGRVTREGPPRDVLARRAGELLDLGVWLPVATLAGLRLREAGMLAPDDDGTDVLPLTPSELRARLPRVPDDEPRDDDSTRDDGGHTVVLTDSGGPTGASASGIRAGISGEDEGLVDESLVDRGLVAGAQDGDESDIAPESRPLLEVRGLTVRRGGRGVTRRRREATGTVVLDDVSLTVRPGELHAVVGVNGAGKSTLLQAIAGVVAPAPGTVRVAGLDPARADLRDLATRVGYVFQNPEHQFVRHTVADELAHALELRRLDPGRIAARVDETLDRFGLRTHRAAHPFLLSGGQKRRLSVGTALIGGADVLVLDEPTFGQDRERAVELLEILGELVRGGTAVVVATHDLQLVAERATHVLVLDDRRVAAHGPTAQVVTSGVLESAGLRPPPLVEALRGTALSHVTRVADLPSRGDVRASARRPVTQESP